MKNPAVFTGHETSPQQISAETIMEKHAFIQHIKEKGNHMKYLSISTQGIVCVPKI